MRLAGAQKAKKAQCDHEGADSLTLGTTRGILAYEEYCAALRERGMSSKDFGQLHPHQRFAWECMAQAVAASVTPQEAASNHVGQRVLKNQTMKEE